ncbi:sugar kinase [Ihubacter massiliensis]|uniref:Sugar kinase n=1 Tax=Hominibacterium faecale TaxID=2839743 RepID=A0A9J6QRZ3_9FIRM|nr:MULTISPECIES: sugar kinase [Eubacteriales Family XIII. Incertae Sedis]MCI7303797.1 sugar kinase [Clostridia bacterium]MCO7123071.1 sugar kinase [Ihubacter massiliensis]MCU7377331.1 sugar kinase [Hominibacterium faecale]MDY3009835.1 sugar kinase [Clostridiales Family XIII bacterium]
MAEIITFGEIMLRLKPEGYLRFFQNDRMEATFGGGEANVAVSLSNFGVDTAFVSKLPPHEIGAAAIRSLNSFGVDTGSIVRGGDRVGIYYLETGASQRPSKVIYDRAGSSIAQAVSGDFDWPAIFDGAKWFHFTGITPALSENTAVLVKEACREAKKRDMTISCDLNFRKKLWSSQEAQRIMEPLMDYVDICIANEEDAEKIFGIQAEDSDVNGGKLNHEGYCSVASQLIERFGFKYAAITLRTSLSANDNRWAAMISDGSQCFFSKEYEIHIVDRVGGGDSFAAGLIYGLYKNMSLKDALEFAAAASCLKHSVEGDFNRVSVEEVNALAAGDGSGRVQR